MNDRTKILQRVLNLRARADDDASSEAEAMAAIERAERLMHAYRIEEAELALAEASGRIGIEIVHQKSRRLQVGGGGWSGKTTRHIAIICQYAICSLTGTDAVNYDGVHPEFTGTRADVEYAIFLQELIADALDREYDNYKRDQRIVGRGAKRAFQISMARRINGRLLEMKRERVAAAKQAKAAEALRLKVDASVVEAMVVPGAQAELTSTALVLLAHDALLKREVERAYRERHPRLGKARGFGISGGFNHSAGYAGHKAGDRVHLGRAIGSGSSSKRIG